MEATSELLERIEGAGENEVLRLAPQLIMWKEGSTYDLEVTNRQFDELEKLLAAQEGEDLYYLIDLSVAGRPTPEMVKLIEERLQPINDRFKHVAVYTGNNFIMYLGIKFYFIRFGFNSYSAHTNLKGALESLFLMDANRIIQHLVDISIGECNITEESIMQLEDKEEQMIQLGLLTLFEEVEFNKKQLEGSNREKEVLLKEIHHRVKNNLQIISSLLKLQNSFVADDNTKTLFRDCSARVSTMAMIHEKLYLASDLGNVDYRDYLEELVKYLKAAYSYSPDKMQVQLDVPALKLNIDTAIPLGLLVNEIFTNSLKYGQNAEGKVDIYLRMEELSDGVFELLIGDHGANYADETFQNGSKSLGIQLMKDLVGQLSGSIEKVNDSAQPGAHYRIRFEEVKA